MGEAKRRRERALVGRGEQGEEAQVVDTLGGRMHVRWDEGAAATPHGQLVFFAQFLAATGVFERWVQGCPLAYHSGNAPDKRDVLGTLMLGLLIANIGAALLHIKAAAEQFKDLDRWDCLLRYISDRIAPVIGPPKPPLRQPAPG